MPGAVEEAGTAGGAGGTYYASLVFRAFLVLLVALTLAAPFVWVVSRAEAGFNSWNYLSFFTMQSNILGMIWMASSVTVQLRNTAGGFSRARLEHRPSASMARAGILLYLLVTMIVYQSVIRGAVGGTALFQARDWVLHAVFPVAFLLDWLIDPGGPALRWRSVLIWLAFPFLYLVYTLSRGLATGWYPYNFLDPDGRGWLMVAAGCAAVLALMLALGSILVVADRIRKKARGGASG